jgi:hypothetical protein
MLIKRRRRRILAFVAPIALGAVVAVAVGGNGHATAGGGFVKADGKPRKDIKHDKSAPLRTITPKLAHKGKQTRAEHRFFTKVKPTQNDPVRQTAAPALGAPTAGQNFDGIDTAALNAQYIPPDPNTAAGPNALVEVVNTAFQVFSKTGVSLYGPADTNTLWSGFGGDCENRDDGDATISYDRISNRWVLQQFSLEPYYSGDGEFLECIAVSATNDPLGEWYRYAFNGFGSEFPDYPKLGVWPDAYYVTYNLFPNDVSYDGPEVCAYERAKMLQGLTATQQCALPGGDHDVSDDANHDPTINGLLPSDFDGSKLPPDGAPNHLLGIKQDPDTNTNSVVAFNFHVDWTTPANSTLEGPTDLGVAAFNLACESNSCDRVPDKSGTNLDSLGDRLMYRLAYRNLGSYEVMVVNHTVVPDGSNSTAVRWYELRKQSSDDWFSVANEGTFAPDSKSRWMGSAATDSAGNMALGYSISSSSIYPGIAYTGKLPADAQMTQGETVFQCGTSIGCGGQMQYSRWGDYSSMSIDPADDCTFWYTNEYLPKTGVFNWKTRIASFSLPGCAAAVVDKFSLSLSPSADTIEQGTSDVSTVGTEVTTGAAQNVDLSATGMPFDTTVSFSPTSVTSGGSSQMTVDVGADTPVGTYKISVRGSGASDLQSQKYTLTVGLHNAVVNGDFEDVSTPLAGWTTTANVSLVTNSSTKKSSKSGPTTPAHAAQVGLSTQNPGADDSLSQQVVVPTGQSALSFWYKPQCGSAKTGDQLKVELGAQTLLAVCSSSKNWVKAAFDTSGYAGQTLTLVFSSHSTGQKKSTYMLVDDVLLSKQLPGIANGDFETGDLTGWQATGAGEYAPTVVSSPARGLHSLRLGTLNDPPDDPGTSSVTQAIVVPGVSPKLKVAYQSPCKDVGYDFVLVQVRKNPGGQVLGTLVSACSKITKWQKRSFDLSAWAGQSVTLALSVTNDVSIPTVAYFDDVSLTSG